MVNSTSDAGTQTDTPAPTPEVKHKPFVILCPKHDDPFCPPFCEEYLKMAQIQIPEEFECPICYCILDLPYVDWSGFTFCGRCIETHGESDNWEYSPMTNQKYHSLFLQALPPLQVNWALRSCMLRWWRDLERKNTKRTILVYHVEQ
jgi:hypothetical protein